MIMRSRVVTASQSQRGEVSNQMSNLIIAVFGKTDSSYRSANIDISRNFINDIYAKCNGNIYINNLYAKPNISTDLGFKHQGKLNGYTFDYRSRVKLNTSRFKGEIDINSTNIANFDESGKTSFTKCPESCITYSCSENDSTVFGTRCEIGQIGVQK